jgi:hypothetical protein
LHQNAERGGSGSIALDEGGVLLLKGMDRKRLADKSKRSLDVSGEVLVGDLGLTRSCSWLGVVRVASNVEFDLLV